MASEELNKMKTILGGLDSQATTNPQPSKNFNSGSNKIDGANPTSPSTNNATRREQYNNYIRTLDQAGRTSLYQTVSNYKEMGLTNDQIYENVLNSANIKPVTATTTSSTTPKTTQGLDLSLKGNFDVYNPIDWKNQPELMQQYYIQANNDIKSARRSLSQYMLQQEALESKSSNINDVTTLIDAIENAYDKGVFDTQTIANTLGVSPEVVSLVQQGKANELVKLDEEFVQDKLKSYFRAEEDYDTNLQRTMEDYELAKTNLDRQYNSAMQTLKRNLFDEKRTASVGSAVAGISGSEYAVKVIEAKHQQNIDDLEGNYLYSSITQKYSYTRAIEDYNKNIQRLSEDFDDALKDIQASVLQQFQEIDSKIGLTTAQLAQAYGTLEQNVATAKANAITNYMTALSNNENGLADAIANTYGLDTSELGVHQFTASELGRTGKETIGNATNNIGHILASSDGTRVGTYKSPNGYTYNVYATREQGLQATIGLLQRAYYGKTLRDAAQKWIGKGKDISVAISVMKGLGLDPNATLSDANVEKFITAMGRWEGTLGKNETLEQWLAGGKDLSGYSSGGTTTTQGGTTTAGNYKTGYEEDYKKFLNEGRSSFTKSSQDSLIKAFGSMENFKANALAYKPVLSAKSASVLQSSLDTLVEFKKRYNELSSADRQALAATETLSNGLIKTAGLSADALNVANLYNQIKGQQFIDGIVESKKNGAGYGNLSDAEGAKIQQSRMAWNLNNPAHIGDHLNYMIRNIAANIREYGQTPDLTSGYSYTGPTTGQKFTTYTPSQYIQAIRNMYGNSNLNVNSSVTGTGFNAIQGNRSFGNGTAGAGTHTTTMK